MISTPEVSDMYTSIAEGIVCHAAAARTSERVESRPREAIRFLLQLVEDYGVEGLKSRSYDVVRHKPHPEIWKEFRI